MMMAIAIIMSAGGAFATSASATEQTVDVALGDVVVKCQTGTLEVTVHNRGTGAISGWKLAIRGDENNGVLINVPAGQSQNFLLTISASNPDQYLVVDLFNEQGQQWDNVEGIDVSRCYPQHDHTSVEVTACQTPSESGPYTIGVAPGGGPFAGTINGRPDAWNLRVQFADGTVDVYNNVMPDADDVYWVPAVLSELPVKITAEWVRLQVGHDAEGKGGMALSVVGWPSCEETETPSNPEQPANPPTVAVPPQPPVVRDTPSVERRPTPPAQPIRVSPELANDLAG